jgi:hypothetical protein
MKCDDYITIYINIAGMSMKRGDKVRDEVRSREQDFGRVARDGDDAPKPTPGRVWGSRTRVAA